MYIHKVIVHRNICTYVTENDHLFLIFLGSTNEMIFRRRDRFLSLKASVIQSFIGRVLHSIRTETSFVWNCSTIGQNYGHIHEICHILSMSLPNFKKVLKICFKLFRSRMYKNYESCRFETKFMICFKIIFLGFTTHFLNLDNYDC